MAEDIWGTTAVPGNRRGQCKARGTGSRRVSQPKRSLLVGIDAAQPGPGRCDSNGGRQGSRRGFAVGWIDASSRQAKPAAQHL